MSSVIVLEPVPNATACRAHARLLLRRGADVAWVTVQPDPERVSPVVVDAATRPGRELLATPAGGEVAFLGGRWTLASREEVIA